MQQNNQQIDLDQTDEIDLKKLFNSLLERKFFILSVTAFITLLAIIYALLITPTYKAISAFTSPSASSMININKLQFTNETKESVFSEFLDNIASQEFQAKTFLDGGYLALFNPEKNSIDIVPDYISNIIRSVTLSRPSLTSKDVDLGFLNEEPYLISMEGNNPKLIARYLNELIDNADKKVINELINNSNQMVDIRLDEILLERKLLVHSAKQRRLNEIIVLKDTASISKSLGIVDNNFSQIGDKNITSNLIIAIGDNQTLPDWYLYGEKALLERANILDNRENDEPFISKLVELDSETLKLKSILNPDISMFSSMQLNQIASAPTNPFKPNKRMIVVLAFIGSFMMSILLALIMGALRTDEQAA